VLGVLSMFFLGKEMFSSKVGIYASLLTAVLPFHITYSQEVRPYSLLFLLCVLSYFFFIKFMKRKNLKWGLLYMVVTSCMLYTHYFGFLIVFAQFVHLSVVFLCDRSLDRWKFLRPYLPIVILLTLPYLPWIGRIRRLARVKKLWTGTPPFDFFISYFKGYFGDELYVVFICIILIGVYLLHKSGTDESPYHKLLLFLSVIVVFFVPYLRSLKHASLLTPRNTIVALPAIVLMASVGLHRFKRAGVQTLVFGSLMLMLLVNIFFTDGNYYRTVTKEQWREAAEYVLDKDPEAKYPVFVDGRIRYYFNDVFKSERILWPRIQTSANAKRASEFISEEKIPGFWVIEAHQRMDKDAQQFLDSRYSVRDRKQLKGVRVTFHTLEEPQN
jgi:4-amino-4-deoxy-L-arabinose transferase-like glycosyltransferase